MPNLETINDLLDHIRSARLAEAIEKYYAEDVVMQDNANPPTVGKAVNVERERAFASAIQEARLDVRSVVLSEDRVVLEYLFDLEMKDGSHLVLDQVSVQQWKDGKVVRERFYYDSSNVVQKQAAA